MQRIRFTDHNGSFVLEEAQKAPSVYLPLVNEAGMISSITPLLAGDCKTSQNTFLLEPASEQALTENRAVRNFWVIPEGGEPWSACGQSAPQLAQRFTPEGNCTLQGGLLWQSVSRTDARNGLHAEVLSFVPADPAHVELMQTTLRNDGRQELKLRCVVAIPLYGRSADNIRDHRHVTSLLQRVEGEKYGILLHSTLTFDERGHRPGDTEYRVWAAGDGGERPEYMIPRVSDFAGAGSLDWPQAIVCPDAAIKKIREGGHAEGGEMIAALFFAPVTLLPGQQKSFQTVLSIGDDPAPYLTPEGVRGALERTKAFWMRMTDDRFCLGQPAFTQWMRWVSAQPLLRRICGCSFLPHHDYGRGGRGWRDLWQDSLALLLQDPVSVRNDLISYFAGVRTDGTNATIIGTQPGEFRADRNNIPRVWMDHGFWPFLTTLLYLNETGDVEFLWEKQSYFEDGLAFRGERKRPSAAEDGNSLKSLPGGKKDKNGQAPEQQSGTVMEHLLTEAVTAFFDAGDHGIIRLRGADWNDGLDMAASRGESVAFTAAYAYSLEELGKLLEHAAGCGTEQAAIAGPLLELLAFDPSGYGDAVRMKDALEKYCGAVYTDWNEYSVSVHLLAQTLRRMAGWLREHIRMQEWTGDHVGQGWFNSYYDDHGKQVDGVHGDTVRMMLTGQVFTLLSGTASQEQAERIIHAADWYLYTPARGGYCLNTDFGEVKMDLGRMFGFAYGSKENGAVFSHMAVMYAYALYSRGFVREGRKVLEQLYVHSTSFCRSVIFPGIPEYFDLDGRGMYPWLTGAASWFLLTLRTQVFGIQGEYGDLVIAPKLTSGEFAEDGEASVFCRFGGVRLHLRIFNPRKLDWNQYRIGRAKVNGHEEACTDTSLRIPASRLSQLARRQRPAQLTGKPGQAAGHFGRTDGDMVDITLELEKV